jgi:hypothetical protein
MCNSLAVSWTPSLWCSPQLPVFITWAQLFQTGSRKVWLISQHRRGINSHFVSSHHLLSLLLILSSYILPLLDQYTITSSVSAVALLTRNSAPRHYKPVRDRVPNCSRTCQATSVYCVSVSSLGGSSPCKGQCNRALCSLLTTAYLKQ